MVKPMLNKRELDPVFHALADATRRQMVERLCGGSATVSDLAKPFGMSLSAIGQHLQVLEKSGLVKSSKVGRIRTVALVPDGLTRAEQWFAHQRARWVLASDRVGKLSAHDPELRLGPEDTLQKSRPPPTEDDPYRSR
jgi:DNA-binding transcriptional ArsR family regulator